LGTINNPYFKSRENKKEILVTWWHVRGGMGMGNEKFNI